MTFDLSPFIIYQRTGQIPLPIVFPKQFKEEIDYPEIN